MSRCALWIPSAVLVASAASAQPVYSVSPDTLDHVWEGDSTLEVANLDADTLAISFPLTGENWGGTTYGTTGDVPLWYFEVEIPGMDYTDLALPYGWEDDGEGPPAFRVAPGDTARFHVRGYDLCPFCRTTEARPDTFDVLYDVLHLRIADAAGADTVRVPFEPVYVVPTEADPTPHILALRLAPNPASERVTIRVESGQTQGAEVVLFDALGRVVRRHRQTTNGGVLFDLRGLPPGIYVVRADVPGVGTATTRLVVTD